MQLRSEGHESLQDALRYLVDEIKLANLELGSILQPDGLPRRCSDRQTDILSPSSDCSSSFVHIRIAPCKTDATR